MLIYWIKNIKRKISYPNVKVYLYFNPIFIKKWKENIKQQKLFESLLHMRIVLELKIRNIDHKYWFFEGIKPKNSNFNSIFETDIGYLCKKRIT